ncbi:hypothetical protein [Actinopolyspora mortivallis]|uniref:hypothetical protein n=1 Tax=Actinopolyspora mortivallis TaxID=33906 RepID=UPI00036F210A|nr:hypothetical protein [Actinopolyspora mortivallis]
MVFQNIFGTAQQTSQSGTSTEQELADHIPLRSACVPQHDPMHQQPPEDTGEPRDPKIVRETSPEARSVLGLVTTLTGITHQAAGQQNTYASDPASTVEAAAPVMHEAHRTTRKAPENLSRDERDSDTRE